MTVLSSPPVRDRRRARLVAVLARRSADALAVASAVPATPSVAASPAAASTVAVAGLPASAASSDVASAVAAGAAVAAPPAAGATDAAAGSTAPAAAPATAGRLVTGPVRVFLLVGALGRPTPALAAALGATGRLVVVGTSSDPVEGVDLAADAAPDAVVVDRFLGLGDGLAVARHLHRDVPRAAIVLRTPWPDADRHDAERAGAGVTVDIDASTDALTTAIVAAASPRD